MSHFLLDLQEYFLGLCHAAWSTLAFSLNVFLERWSDIVLQHHLIQPTIHSWPGLAVAKQPETLMFPPSRSTADMRFLCFNAVFGLYQTCLLLPQINKLWIHLSKAHCSRSHGLCLQWFPCEVSTRWWMHVL